jgi:hypothetical protein
LWLTDSSGNEGTGRIQAKSSGRPEYCIGTCVVTVPSSWMNRIFSLTWLIGKVEQKNPPQAKDAAGKRVSRKAERYAVVFWPYPGTVHPPSEFYLKRQLPGIDIFAERGFHKSASLARPAGITSIYADITGQIVVRRQIQDCGCKLLKKFTRFRDAPEVQEDLLLKHDTLV